MPTYEYRCKDCGEHLEVVQTFTDDALTECPACGGKLRKVFGNIGITFKGSGFYKTDSRDGAKKKTATKDKESADSTSSSTSTTSESSSTSSTDAKPATPVGGDSKPAKKPKSSSSDAA